MMSNACGGAGLGVAKNTSCTRSRCAISCPVAMLHRSRRARHGENVQVIRAAVRQSRMIQDRGATALSYLPHVCDGKTGVDDYYVASSARARRRQVMRCARLRLSPLRGR